MASSRLPPTPSPWLPPPADTPGPQEYGEKAMSRSTFQKSKGGADPVKYQRIVGRVGPQLSVILNLSVAIRASIVENVAGQVRRKRRAFRANGCKVS